MCASLHMCSYKFSWNEFVYSSSCCRSVLGAHVYVCEFMWVRVYVCARTHEHTRGHVYVLNTSHVHKTWSCNTPTLVRRHTKPNDRPKHIAMNDRYTYTFAPSPSFSSCSILRVFLFLYSLSSFSFSLSLSRLVSDCSHTNAAINVYVCLSVNIKCPIQRKGERERA